MEEIGANGRGIDSQTAEIYFVSVSNACLNCTSILVFPEWVGGNFENVPCGCLKGLSHEN